MSGGVKSTLIIRDSQSYHYGKYNCTVVNDYGNDVLEITLQPQSKYIYYRDGIIIRTLEDKGLAFFMAVR